MAKESGRTHRGASKSASEARDGFDFTTNVLHVDGDEICPKCLTWIGPRDIVRRTGYGLLQHEVCNPLNTCD